jgi:UDP-N-acetylmuramoylalanine--D-glutamate ligase
MKIAILGFGKEGKSVLSCLKRKRTTGEIWVLDENPRLKVPKSCKAQLGKRYLAHLERFDVVYRSPGVPFLHPVLQKARRRGVVISSATRLFLESLEGKHATIIGVTGSKGKSTTATLIYGMLKAGRRNAYLVGNIGKSTLDILPKLRKKPCVVMELSSFQLQDFKNSPHIAVVTETFPEHQDSHGSLREYYSAKANIARHQSKKDTVFFFKGNNAGAWIAKQSKGKKVPISEKGFSLFAPTDLRIPGFHTFKNAVMAATVAKHLKVPATAIRKTAQGFRGLEHRLELVRTIHLRGSNKKPIRNIRVHSDISDRIVEFYNDSLSTNAHTIAKAAGVFNDRDVVLLAGGYDKKLNYAPLARAFPRSTVRLVVLYGQNKKKIYAAIRKTKTPVVFAKTLKAAVLAAYRFALRPFPLSPFPFPHWAILLSPGTSSYDTFENYAERGETFKRIVNHLH